MNDTCCFAYINGDVDHFPSMEDILYDGEYSMYNSDIQLDSFVYCVALGCNPPYCAALGL